MPYFAGASIAAPVIGGLIGNAMSQGDKDKALALQQQALNNIMSVNTPDANAMKVALQKYQSAGQLSPQMESLINQGPSAMNNIQTDPRLLNAEMQSLRTMQQLGQTGLRPQDLAALNQIQQQANTQENANRQAILQNMAQRGLGGSGAELASQLSNEQSSANSARQAGLNVAGQASQNALQAMYNSGQLGGQMQQAEFGQQAQIANANDLIARYNAMNAQQVGNTNTAYQNQAQAQNLANAQNIANMNTQTGNQQALYNSSMTQQAYQDALQKAAAASGQYGNIAGTYNQNAANTQAMFGGMGQGAGKAATAIYGYNAGKQAGQASAGGGNQQSDNTGGGASSQDWYNYMSS